MRWFIEKFTIIGSKEKKTIIVSDVLGVVYDKNHVCLPWEYLQKPDGRVYNERLSQEERRRISL